MASWIKLKSIENISWQWNSSYVLWPIFPTAFQRIAVFTWKKKRDSISSSHEWFKQAENNCLFVFLFGVFVPLENFSLIWRRTIAGEGLHILTYARHLWPLRSEASLACHTYCDTGHLFTMVTTEDPWHSHLMLSVWQWSCHYLFLRFRSVEAGIRTSNLPLAVQTL